MRSVWISLRWVHVLIQASLASEKRRLMRCSGSSSRLLQAPTEPPWSQSLRRSSKPPRIRCGRRGRYLPHNRHVVRRQSAKLEGSEQVQECTESSAAHAQEDHACRCWKGARHTNSTRKRQHTHARWHNKRDNKRKWNRERVYERQRKRDSIGTGREV